MADIEVRLSGPMFDGRAVHIIGRMASDCQRHVADGVEEAWQSRMDATFQHSTGRYQSNINIATRSQDLVVNDRGVIYGYWLEGIGSRNYPVTRFRGYFNRRRTVQYIRGQVGALCEPIVNRALEEINHG